VAQRTEVYRKAGFLTAPRVAKLIKRFEELGMQPYTNNSDVDLDREGDWIHVTRYLQERDVFRRLFPKLRASILALAREANAAHAWGLDLSAPSFRCAEYHHYRPGGCLPEQEHYDKGSAVTVDVMLEPALGGGEFQTLEEGGGLRVHDFAIGDAVVFVAHKYHMVTLNPKP